eukprot:s10838_g2.t1
MAAMALRKPDETLFRGVSRARAEAGILALMYLEGEAGLRDGDYGLKPGCSSCADAALKAGVLSALQTSSSSTSSTSSSSESATAAMASREPEPDDLPAATAAAGASSDSPATAAAAASSASPVVRPSDPSASSAPRLAAPAPKVVPARFQPSESGAPEPKRIRRERGGRFVQYYNAWYYGTP